jgi:hypothetical protein
MQRNNKKYKSFVENIKRHEGIYPGFFDELNNIDFGSAFREKYRNSQL